VSLLVAAPRPERAAWLVEKATEVGAAAVRFVAWARAARAFGGGQLGRLERVARAAVEQCGRARLPELSGPHDTADLPRLLPAGSAVWRLDPAGAAALPAGGEGPCALLVGPEGGWGPRDEPALAALGAAAVRLGPRALRLETAALVGLALLLAPV
jgi:16S rRNA (uracil1498-N3)-methyltransferase